MVLNLLCSLLQQGHTIWHLKKILIMKDFCRTPSYKYFQLVNYLILKDMFVVICWWYLILFDQQSETKFAMINNREAACPHIWEDTAEYIKLSSCDGPPFWFPAPPFFFYMESQWVIRAAMPAPVRWHGYMRTRTIYPNWYFVGCPAEPHHHELYTFSAFCFWLLLLYF